MLHRIAAEAKIVATLGFVLCVAATPRQAVWAFGVYAIVLVVLIALSHVRFRFVGLRLLAVVPFLLFAVFVPFIAGGETVDLAGLQLSIEGLWGTWNILAKAILGASATIVLTATTEIPDIIRGLGHLHVPIVFTSIAMFMVRYLELVADELGRMRVAMTSRGYDPRWLAQARPIAAGAGAMFVRSYERAERVHAAMLARGFSGAMPDLDHRRADSSEWLAVGGLVVGCVVVAVAAMLLT